MAVFSGRKCIGYSASVLAAISAMLWYTTLYKHISVGWRIVTGILAIITSAASVIGFHIITLRCSKYASTSHLLLLYSLGNLLLKLSANRHKKLLQQTKHICRAQEAFLLARLRKHGNTEYGRRFKFNEISSSSEYRSRHPLTQYKDLEEYIEREANGESGVLLAEKPVQFGLTSGTTGKPKLIPRSMEQKTYFASGGFAVTKYALFEMERSMGLNNSTLQKWCNIYVDPSVTFSKAGVMMSSVSKNHESDVKISTILTGTPASGFKIAGERSAYYVHALFALRDRNMGVIQGYISSVVYGFLRLIELEWENLVDDIERGTLNQELDLPLSIREDLEKELVSDEERASELKQEFQRGFQGIVKRVWPFISCVMAATSGSFAVYADILRETYCKGLPLYSALYMTSEGILAVSLWPDEPKHRNQYVFLPDGAYFEFIPVDYSNEEQPSTSLLNELGIGQSYELVITNMDGLYRYRIGDVIKVVDFFNQSPIVEFQYRIGEILNIRGEKTSEDCIVGALSSTLKNWGNFELTEYACAENTIVDSTENAMSLLPHYVIFVEIHGLAATEKHREAQAKQLDEALCNTAAAYKFLRNKGSLGRLRFVVVRPGSFKALRDYILNNSTTSCNQFKMPRKLRKQEWVELLLLRVEN